MRRYTALIDRISMPPDTIQRILLTGGSSAQAMDWVTSTGAAVSSVAQAHIVRVTGMTTAGAQAHLFFDPVSTFATVLASGSSVSTGSTVGSTGNSIPLFGSREFRIPAWSTGFSVASYSSGFAIVESWRI